MPPLPPDWFNSGRRQQPTKSLSKAASIFRNAGRLEKRWQASALQNGWLSAQTDLKPSAYGAMPALGRRLVNIEDLTEDDYDQMSTAELRAIEAHCTAVIEAEGRGADDPACVHDVHHAGLTDELAPREAGGEAGPGGDGAVPPADDLPAPPAREERTGEPPLSGVSPRPEPGSAAHRLLPHE